MERVRLHDVDGIAIKSGIDEHGNLWTQFEVDYLAQQEDGECVICGKTLTSGWTCLDGGEEVCDEHVEFGGELISRGDEEERR